MFKISPDEERAIKAAGQRTQNRMQRLEEEYHKSNRQVSELIELCKQTLYDYAWWKDGIQYVGCGTKRWEKALIELDTKIHKIID